MEKPMVEKDNVMSCVGTHLGKSKSILNTLQEYIQTRNFPLPACQMFLRSSRGGKSSLTDKEIDQVKELIENTGLKFYVHAPYVINLSNPYTKKDPLSDKWALDMLRDDLNKCNRMGGKGVVIHVGKYLKMSKEDALDKMEHNIKQVLVEATEECPLLLETPAGEGTELCSEFSEFLKFSERFKDDKRFGICIDTCHVFAANHDPETYINDWLESFPNTLKLIHFNDSQKCKGSHVDRHAYMGRGYIGYEKLYNVAKLGCANGISMVVE